MKNYYFLFVTFFVPAFHSLVLGQCCPAGTVGVVETTSTRDGSSASQAGTGVAWTSVANAADPDGSNATNVGSGLGVGIVLAVTPRPVTIAVPAFTIPVGQRFCSASVAVTATYSFSPTLGLGLLPYANLTATLPVGGLTQANVTAGFNLVITGVYGFTGLGTITLRLDGVRMSVITQTGCPLPVELTDFSGQQEGRCAKLSWTTATELNNDHFTIQKRIGESYVNIGTVESLYGTTQQQSDYTFTDCDVSPINYYRLVQTDNNGYEEIISDLISVPIDMAEPGDLRIIPNPATDVACVYSDDNLTMLQVISLEGKIVYDQTFPDKVTNFCIPVTELSSGVYMVRIATAGGIYSRQLVKQ